MSHTGEILLFINQETLNEEVRTYLAGLGVKLYDYNDIYQVVPSFKNETVMLEKAHVNYAVCQSLDNSVTVVDMMNPTSSAKAVKNPV